MTTRVQELLGRLEAIGHDAADLADTIDTWGLDQHTAGAVIKANLGVVATMAAQSRALAQAEQDRFPVEASLAPRVGDFIVTRSGNRFWPLDPRPDEVLPEDIAWALSMTCRFGRHPRRFYSVAEHTLHVRHLVNLRVGDTEEALLAMAYATVHDAHEAYLADVVRPVARHLRGWPAIEAAAQDAVSAAFGLPPISPEIEEVVTWADNVALVLEVRSLFPDAAARSHWESDPHMPRVDPRELTIDLARFEDDPLAGPREALLPELDLLWKTARTAEVMAAQEAAAKGTDPEPQNATWRDELTISIEPAEWCKVCELDGKRSPAVENGLCADCAPF